MAGTRRAAGTARLGPARGAAPGLMLVAPADVLPPLIRREDEREAAVDARQREVRFHRPTMARPRTLFKVAPEGCSRYNYSTRHGRPLPRLEKGAATP